MANDLISRDAVLNLATYLWDEYLGTIPCVPCEDIEKLPAVDVVPCKECKHWVFTGEGRGDCTNGRFHLDGHADPTMEMSDFCSLGERRTNNG